MIYYNEHLQSQNAAENMSVKLSLNVFKQLAKDFDGECLSTEYMAINKKLKFKCKFGHFFEKSPLAIRHCKSWCPKCFGRNKTIDDMQIVAEKRGGQCLSDRYLGAHKALKWMCKNKHIWNAAPTNILRNHWCPYCAGQIVTIENMQKLAETKYGKCLSEAFVNVKTKLKWECSSGHIWEATPNNIKTGKWCPECTKSLSEKICRHYFETIFGLPFPNCRPNWLRSPITNKKLELDGYCIELGIAFEHNGEQHYKNKFNVSHDKFIKYKYNDNVKQKICELYGVKLIVIPQLFGIVKIEDLKHFIKIQCERFKIVLPENFDKLKINENDIYKINK
jgi:hypothetical protein